MKKTTKLTAILLTLVLVLGTCSAAFCVGAQSDTAVTQTSSPVYPLIILPGINHSVSYVANEDGTVALNDDGKELSGGLLIIDTAGLAGKLIKKLLWPLLSTLFLQFDNGLSSAAYDVVCDLFSTQASDKNGVQIENLKTDFYDYPVSGMDEETKDWFYRMLPMKKVSEKIGEENVYLYTFPLIGDPMVSGQGLVDYIELVKKQRNVDKVNIATVSLGGTILTSYADIIDGDWSNVNAIINVVSLHDGTDVIADFYAREWNLSDEYLYSQYAKNLMKQSNGTSTLGCLINVAIRLFSRKTVERLLTGAYDGVLDTLLVNAPQFWAMIPSHRYDELAERYLSGEEYAVLRAKTDAFQKARLDLEENLLAASEQGVSINNICGSNLDYDDGEYGFLGIVASTATCNSDGIIPVYSSSMGATCVPVTETFDDAYLEAARLKGTAKYISPTKNIDASTCLFPDNVWFFVGQHHEIGTNDVAIELLSRIITGEVTDVNSSELFPQYNGFRNTKRLTRWYFDDAQTVMENEDGKYTDEQIAQVQKAYDEANALLSSYTLGENAQQEADAVMDALEDALVNTGIREKSKGVQGYETLIEKIAETFDGVILRIFKGNGFFDCTGIGKVNSKLFGK